MLASSCRPISCRGRAEPPRAVMTSACDTCSSASRPRYLRSECNQPATTRAGDPSASPSAHTPRDSKNRRRVRHTGGHHHVLIDSSRPADRSRTAGREASSAGPPPPPPSHLGGTPRARPRTCAPATSAAPGGAAVRAPPWPRPESAEDVARRTDRAPLLPPPLPSSYRLVVTTVTTTRRGRRRTSVVVPDVVVPGAAMCGIVMAAARKSWSGCGRRRAALPDPTW